MKSRYIVFAALLAAVVGALFVVLESVSMRRDSSIAAVSACLQMPELKERNSCLQTAISNALATHSPAEVLSFSDAAASHPATLVAHCHEIAHVVGAQTLQKNGNLEQTLAACPRLCNDGCTHGAVEAEVVKELGEKYSEDDITHADADTIRAIGSTYCKRSYALCHGIGHIL